VNADALVIGAGPAGSAAARMLALQGLHVRLVDRFDFPRDKVCGDALIPDAVAALTELGVRHGVLGGARRLDRIRVYAPNHSYVALEGACASVPRLALDDSLRRAAVDAGAQFHPRLRAVRPLEAGGAVVGARFENTRTWGQVEVRAPLTILATGATSDVLARFGMCLRTNPSATAARIYVKVAPDHAAAWDHLCFAYSKSICPGYGWIFPGPGDVFNVGVGYYYDARNLPRERNVRKLLATFLTEFPPAAELMTQAVAVSELQGAPLRTAMEGAVFGRPGLLVAGEAAGLTYSFSGEGIGKALESGIIAARIVKMYGVAPSQDAVDAYSTTLGAFARRFRAYAKMQRWLAYPAFLNFLAWRGRSGRYVREQLEGLLNETGNPEELLSFRGLARAVIR
jgi:geranylgeranyl reductase family protein